MNQPRLIFLVEGDCEVWFVHNCIIPHLYQFPAAVENKWSMNAQKITTNRKLNVKGGVINYPLVKNELGRITSNGTPWVTTMFDYFRIPSDFPGYAQGLEAIEQGIKQDIRYDRLLPYIQKFEFEALLFADPKAFHNLDINEKQWKMINDISERYHVVEDINGGQTTAPSKRLASIFHYEKTQDSKNVLKNIPLEVLISRAPHFRAWMEQMEKIIQG